MARTIVRLLTMRFLRATWIALLPLALLTSAACKEEQTGVQVKEFSFSGNKAVPTAQLRSVLATAVTGRLPWAPREYFSREDFDADLKRIVAFYHDRGFPDARIESFDVRLSDDQKSVRLNVVIDEGEPIIVERVVLKGMEVLPEERLHSLQSRLPLKVNAPLDRALLQASREATIDELKDHGYPHPTVKTLESPGATERSRVVTYDAEPGRLAYFGRIQIVGTSSVAPRIVRRQLTFRTGQLFRESKLRESQRKLYAMELFNFVNIEPVGEVGEGAASQEGEADQIATRATVTEGKHRKVNFSVGYGSEERARVEIDWRHVNFFGNARTAGVLARYSALDRGVRLNLRQPYFFSPRYSLGMSAQSWFSDEPAYKLTTIGGRVTIAREFGRRYAALGVQQATTLALTYANEWEDYKVSEEALNDPTFRDDLIALGLDPTTGADTGRLSSLMFDAGRNTTGNLLDATKGYVASIHLETAGQWLGGDFDYREVSAEGRYYQTLGRHFVGAIRARAGSLDSPEGDDGVPFFKRYFLGGSTNLRGWGRFEVSPLTDEGLPIGGLTFLNFSTELRFPLARKFGGALFVDGGNVWSNAWDFNLNDMRYDAGVGLRYLTPVGPLRLDVGWQLNPIPGLIINGELQKRPMRVHFSIGQAF